MPDRNVNGQKPVSLTAGTLLEKYQSSLPGVENSKPPVPKKSGGSVDELYSSLYGSDQDISIEALYNRLYGGEEEKKEISFLDEVSRGFTGGVKGVQQGYYGTRAMLANDENVRSRFLDKYNRLSEQMQENQTSVPEFTKIKSVEDAARWFTGTSAQMAPIVGSIMAGGLLGAKAGSIAGPKGTIAGSMAGSFAVGYKLYAGSLYGDIREMGAEHDEAKSAALTYGVPASAVSIVLPAAASASIVGAFGKQYVKNRMKNMIVGAGISTPAEGLAEAAAESFVIMGEEEALGITYSQQEKRHRIINAGAAGALMGTQTGTIGGAGFKRGTVDDVIDGFLDHVEKIDGQAARPTIVNFLTNRMEQNSGNLTENQQQLLKFLKSDNPTKNKPIVESVNRIDEIIVKVASRSEQVNEGRLQDLEAKDQANSLTHDEAIEFTSIIVNNPKLLGKLSAEVEVNRDLRQARQQQEIFEQRVAEKETIRTGIYDEQEVRIKGQDESGDFYIEVDGKEKVVQAELIEDIQDITPEQQVIAEMEAEQAEQEQQAEQVAQQDIESGEEGVIEDPATGDLLYPGQEGYDQAQQAKQNEQSRRSSMVIGRGKEKQQVNMRQEPDGSFSVLTIDRATEEAIEQVPVEELNGTEINTVVKQLEDELKNRGDFVVDSFPADASDPFGAMKIFISPAEQAGAGKVETPDKKAIPDTPGETIGAQGRNSEAEFTPEVRTDLEIGSEEVGGANPAFREATVALGRTENRTLETGEKRHTQYAVVPLESVLASHNEVNFSQTEGYPMLEDGRSPNDNDYRNSQEAQESVDNIARNLDERIFQNIPTVSTDGIVVDGNNRTMSVKRASRSYPDRYDWYRQQIQERAEEFGISPEEVAGIENPVLVRIDRDVAEYSTEEYAKYNRQPNKEKSSIEKAVVVSKSIDGNTLSRLTALLDFEKHSTINQALSDRGTAKNVVDLLQNNGIINANERARYFDAKTGSITNAGKELVSLVARGSILNERALRNSNLDGVRQLANAMETSLPILIKLRANFPEYDISNLLSGAVMLERIRVDQELTVNEMYSQQSMFSDMSVDKDTALIHFILKKGPNNFKRAMQVYYNAVESGAGGTMFETEPRSQAQIIDDLISYLEEKTGDTDDKAAIQRIRQLERKQVQADSQITGRDEGAVEPGRPAKPESDPEPAPAKPTKAEELKKKEDKVKEDLSRLFDEFDDQIGGKLSAGFDPKLIEISSRIIAKGSELGYVKFQQFADFVISSKGADFFRRIFDNFKAAYMSAVGLEGNPNNEDLNVLAKAKADDFISDEKAYTPELSSTQFNLNDKVLNKRIIEFAESIPDAELYEDGSGQYGRETEPHITLLYGLTENNPQAVQELLQEAGSVEVTLGETSLFKSSSNGVLIDVLKIEVEGDKLRELHQRLKDSLPNKSAFPDYNPHITIAYLKAGEGAKYDGDKRFEGQKMILNELIHSSPDRTHTPISIASRNQDFQQEAVSYKGGWYTDSNGEQYRVSAVDVAPESATLSFDGRDDLTLTQDEFYSLIDGETDAKLRLSPGKFLEGSPTSKKVKPAEKVIPKDRWRESLIKARMYARDLGVEGTESIWSDREALVAKIDEHLGNDVQPAESTIESTEQFYQEVERRVAIRERGAINQPLNSDGNVKLVLDKAIDEVATDLFKELDNDIAVKAYNDISSHKEGIVNRILESRKSIEDEVEGIPGISGKESNFVSSVIQILGVNKPIKDTEELISLSKKAGMEMGVDFQNPKDLYDLTELALNLHVKEALSSNKDIFSDPETIIGYLNEVSALLPKEGYRSQEQQIYQQFSTPLAYSYAASYAAMLKPSDVVLEPSAGVGNLAVFPMIYGSRTYVNELNNRRRKLLEGLKADGLYGVDAAHIYAMPELSHVKPDVIVVNPPFSREAEKTGDKLNVKVGSRHIHAALRKLKPDGRLVGIVSSAMGMNDPRFKKWWDTIKKDYTVRANILVSGKAYTQKGTSFDNRLLIIDNINPDNADYKVFTAKAQSYNELISYINNTESRTYGPVNRHTEGEPQRPSDQPGSKREAQSTESTGQSKSPSRSESTSRSDEQSGERVQSGRPAGDRGSGAGSVNAGEQQGGFDLFDSPGRTGENEGSDGSTTADGKRRVSDEIINGRSNRPGDSRGDGVSDTQENTADRENQHDVVRKDRKVSNRKDVGYDPYQAEIELKNSKDHPALLVESTAMASVQLPSTDYVPSISKQVIESGALSKAQIEDIILAGNAHNQTNFDGTTKGFFLGAGTGYGKGRTIAGIILDNWNQGRKKAIWMSKNKKAHKDSPEYLSDIGGKDIPVQYQNKAKLGEKIKLEEGVILSTYATLRTERENGSRIDQLVDWLGRDFNGVIVFDESHEMANAKDSKGNRGMKSASQQALAGIKLQDSLPKAKIVYSSATGATEVMNLAYASRLGLWGEVTSFADSHEFINQIDASGVSAMEIIAKDLKAMGLYTAKSISYEGVEYDGIQHSLSVEQKDLYNMTGKAWRTIFKNINQAFEANNTGSRGKAAAMSHFWGTLQRFYSQIITTMSMPTVLADMETQLAEGNAIVVQLINTYEASTDRALAKAKAEAQKRGEPVDLDSLDLSSKSILIELLENAFPTQLYEVRLDDEGNEISVPVTDSEGNPVPNPEAEAMRDRLIEEIEQNIVLPESPLDMILNRFGVENVAEVTGRSKRIVRVTDEQGGYKRVEQSWGETKSLNDVDKFMADEKQILIFSQAGGTGASFHADNTKKNKRQRVQYILQAGWRADVAVQGFGRTHRSNQAQPPIFKLVTTDLKAQSRFLSSISRRLEQLGALTKGQRDTGGGGVLDGSFNLEGKYARQALYSTYDDIAKNKLEGVDAKTVTEDMAINLYDEESATGYNMDLVYDTKKFMNRIMALDVDVQNIIFDHWMDNMAAEIQSAKEAGRYDDGIQAVDAESIKVTDQQSIYKDDSTGAETFITEFDVEKVNEKQSFKKIQQHLSPLGSRFLGFFKHATSGKIYAIQELGQSVDAAGFVSMKYRRYGIGYNTIIDQNEYNSGKYESLSNEQAEPLWEQQYNEYPDTRIVKEGIIEGLMLPIWNRLPEDIDVRRYIDDKGVAHLGRYFKDQDLQKIRDEFAIANNESHTPAQLHQAISQGGRIRLANGITFEAGRVEGELVAIVDSDSVPIGKKSRLGDYGFQTKVTNALMGYRDYYTPMSTFNEVLSRTVEGMSAPVINVTDAEGNTIRGQKPMANILDGGARPTASPDQIRDHLKSIIKGWKSKGFVNIVNSPDELPAGLRRFLERSGDRVGGLYLNGKVFLMPYNMNSITEAEKTLRHEVIGHLGVRGLLTHLSSYNRLDFEKRLDDLSAEIHESFKNEATYQRVIEKYGLNPENSLYDRSLVAQEYIAHLAETGHESTLVDRFMALIEDILKALGMKRGITRNEIRKLIRDAERYVNNDLTYFKDGEMKTVFRFSDYNHTFYSQLENTLEAKLPNSGAAEILKEAIEGMERKGDFRKAEIEWVGLYEWLDEKTGTLSKQEVLEFVRDHNVKLGEVMLQDVQDTRLSVDEIENVSDLDTTWLVEFDNTFEMEISKDEADNPDDAAARAIELFNEDPEMFLDEPVDLDRVTRYADHTLPGGKDYRELLITLPDQYVEHRRKVYERFQPSIDKAREELDKVSGTGEEYQKASRGYYDLINERDAEANRNFTMEEFESSHFEDTENVLAHVRFNTRGETLFLEEIQSDWHQEGREFGYGHTNDYVWELKQVQDQLSREVEKADNLGFHTTGQAVSAIRDATDFEAQFDLESYPEIIELGRKYKEIYQKRVGAEMKVPDAPFKKTWHELVVKKMIRHAAENGYDHVAWTPGQVQADRYDLSKKVDQIRKESGLEDSSFYHISMPQTSLSFQVDEGSTKIRNVAGDTRLAKEIEGKELSELVGKELAEKLIAAPEGAQFSGDDLKVGGDGMKGFYDKILPRFLNKYLKKFDSKLGTRKMKFADKQIEVWSFPVTEKMRDVALKQGQPMFRRSGVNLDDHSFKYQRRYDKFVRKFQDAGIAAKRTIEGVKREGGKVQDQGDFYQDETLARGRIGTILDKFKIGPRQELLEVMQKGNKEKGISHKDYNNYLYARHAPEVNAHFLNKNPGGGTSQSGMSNSEASMILEDVKEKGWQKDMDAMAEIVDRIIDANLKQQVAYGLISPKRYGQLKRQWKHYVPLRGFEEFQDVDPTLHVLPTRRQGRSSKAGDILAYTTAMFETTVIRGEQNLVKQKALRFAQDNYDRTDLMEIKNVYWQDTGKIDEETGKKIYLAQFDPPTAQELLEGTVVREIDPEKAISEWKAPKNPFMDNQVRVMKDGRPVVIEFQDPHIAEWLNRSDMDGISDSLSALQKYMSFLRNAYITYSPEFPIRNLFRDGTTGSLHIATDFDAKTAAAIANPVRLAKAYRAMFRALKSGDYEGRWGQAAKKFLEKGAMSGYFQLNPLKRISKDLQNEIENHGELWYQSKKAVKSLGEYMQHYTSGIENVIRLSAFDYFLDNDVVNPKTGKPFTEKQAAKYVKDLTVNFNRKGSWGPNVGTFYIFFNATIQGIARQFEPFSAGNSIRRKTRAAALPLIMGSVAYAMSDMLRIALGVDEDDEYRFDKINDFTVSHRIIFPNFFTGDPDDTISIPLPYGLNTYWAAGVYANKITSGTLKPADAVLKLGSIAYQSYNPIGGEVTGAGAGYSAVKTVLPTVFIPPFELITNRDFTGRNITPAQFPFGPQAPNFKNYKYYTSTWAKKAAAALNKLTGGDEYSSGALDVSPNQLEHIVSSYLGGAGHFAMSMNNSVGQILNHAMGREKMTGDDVRRIPMARVFFSKVPQSRARTQYVENYKQIEQLGWQHDQILEKEGLDKAERYWEKNSDLLNLISLKDYTKSQVNRRFKVLNRLNGIGDPNNDSEKILEEIGELYNNFNKEVNQSKGRAASQNPVSVKRLTSILED